MSSQPKISFIDTTRACVCTMPYIALKGASATLPVDVMAAVCVVESEDNGGIAVLENVLCSQQGEEHQIDARGAKHVAVGHLLPPNVWMVKKCGAP